MSKALDAIKRANLISVDYDGVLLQLIFNKPGDVVPKAVVTKLPFLSNLFSNFRNAMPGAIEGINTLAVMNKRMVVLTARNALTSILAKNWLKSEGIDKHFDGFYHAKFVEHFGEFKESIIRKLNVDIHIDDSANIIRHLSHAFPHKTFIWLSSRTDDLKNLGFGTNVIHVKRWPDLFKED